MSHVETILAHRYAQAFFDVFEANLSPDVITRINQVLDFLESQKEQVCIPTFAYHLTQSAQEVLTSLLLDAAELPDSFNRLIELLVKEQRASLMPSILRAIVRIYYKKNTIGEFSITSSHDLSDSQIEQMKKFIARKTGLTVIFTYKIDPSLIAGVRFESRVHLWEYSVRKNLASMRNAVRNKVRYG